MIFNPFLTIFSLIIGTVLGFISSLIISYFKQRYDISLKLIAKYFEIKEELTDKLSILASLENTNDLNGLSFIKIKQEISILYYKYYDFLPSEILTEILCLYSCLSDKKNKLYQSKDNCILPLTDSDLKEFIERISLIENFRYYALVRLKSNDDTVRIAAAISYQARSVLIAINKYFNIKDLMSWSRYLPKRDYDANLFNNNFRLSQFGYIKLILKKK